MSWDVFVFGTSQKKIGSVDDIDQEQFIPTDFNAILEARFQNIIVDGDHRSVHGPDYSIDYFLNGQPEAGQMCQLDGEGALFELAALAKEHGWQIADTGNGEIVDLDNPGQNGQESHQAYLQQILAGKDGDKQ